MTMVPDPRWPPRLARLYSEDVRKLEAIHADHISPGAKTWAEAVEALFQRMAKAGPVKGSRLLQKAIDYLDNIDGDQQSHFMIATNCRGRMAMLMFATFNIGVHPDPRVKEDGLTVVLHAIHCSRSRFARVTGIPVAYISMHALRRLFERGYDITEDTSHARRHFAFVGGARLSDAPIRKARQWRTQPAVLRHIGGWIAASLHENLLERSPA